MPKVTVTNLQSKTIDCVDKTEKLLNILLEETDWMHSCGGKGRCTTCSAIILEGMENISELSDAEKKFRVVGKLTSSMRLSCQCHIFGDIIIEVPKNYQLPHLKYS